MDQVIFDSPQSAIVYA